MPIEITWLGHSTFQLRVDSGEVLLLDPWLEGNPACPPGYTPHRVDAILISHGHFDHVSSAVEVAKKYQAKVAGIYEVCMWLQSKGIENIAPMNKGGSQQVGPVTVTMVHALHSSTIDDGGRSIPGGEAAGFVLRFADGRAAYFAGDTDVFGDMQLIRELYQPELAFLPIGDLFTMGPKQAALACKLIRPAKVIPMHYGTFPPLVGRPEELAAQIAGLGDVEVWTLEPGKPVQW